MTQPAAEIRHVVDRSGFANPLTLGVLVEDVDYLKVYADLELLQVGVDYTVLGIGDANGVTIEIIGADDINEYVGYESFTALYDPVLQQGADLSLGGNFGRAFESALDIQNRQLQAVAERAYAVSANTDAAAESALAAAAAEAAAELAADAAEDAAAIAAAGAGTLVFATKALAAAYSPAIAPDFLPTAGYAAAGDLGGARYKKVADQPSHEGKFSITLSGGGVVWYELAESRPTPQMFGAKGDGTTDDTTAFVNLFAYGLHCYWPAATYVVSTLTPPAGTQITTAGFATVIQQKAGLGTDTQIINISYSNISILPAITGRGNIATDTGEQRAFIYIRGTLRNIRIGDVVGINLRGDVVAINGKTAFPLYGVSVGNVYGDNILRNVVTVTGGQGIEIGRVDGTAVGFMMVDVEPDPGGQLCDQITVKNVRGHTIGVNGLPVQRDTRVGRVTFEGLDLNPAHVADSTPAYGFRAATINDAVHIRNAESVTLRNLKTRGHGRSSVFVTFNAGEYGVGDLALSNIDFEDGIVTDTVYRSHIVASAARNLTISGGHYRVSSATHRLVFGDGDGVNGTSKVSPNVDIAVEGNGIIGYGLRKGRVRAKIHPAAGRVLHTVRAAATADTNIATLANGSTMDTSVVLATNDIVLLPVQATGSQNGLYKINAAGPATRYTGADASAEFVESYAYIREGTVNAGKYFACTNASAPTLGTTTITYAEDVPYDAYLFSNCRDLNINGSDFTLGRAGIDCINFTISGTTWRTTHASIVWAVSALTLGTMHMLFNSYFVTLALVSTFWAFGPYVRDYRMALNFGGTYYWPDNSNLLRWKTSAPTSPTDGTLV